VILAPPARCVNGFANGTWRGGETRRYGQLTALVKTRLKQMQYRPGLIEGFLAKTGLDLTPFSNPTIKDLLASGCCEGVTAKCSNRVVRY
jgi:hypothetical protein